MRYSNNKEGGAPCVVWGRYVGALVLLYHQEICRRKHWFESEIYSLLSLLHPSSIIASVMDFPMVGYKLLAQLVVGLQSSTNKSNYILVYKNICF
jgi:hypothetical protein